MRMAADIATAAQRRFNLRVLLLVALGFVTVICAGIAATLVLARAQEQARWVEHTFQVEREVNAIRLALSEMRAQRRGLLLGLSTASAGGVRRAGRDLRQAVDRVGALTGDNPRQQRHVAEMRQLAARINQVLLVSLQPGAQAEAGEPARQAIGTALDRTIGATLAEEAGLLQRRQAAQRASVVTFYVVVGLAGVLLLLVAIGSVSVILRYTRDLGAARDRLRALNEDLEGAVAERTRDLTRANDEIQRFAYIVSHDLRSPLVNVMGFTAELEAATKPLSRLVERVAAEAPAVLTEEARLAAQEDLPEAIGFIRGSTQKMDRLINAILRLSREGRRVIAAEAVDADALADGVVANFAHRTAEIGAEIAVERPMPPVHTDRLALEQILSNLVENALKYLQPGRPGRVTIGGRREGARVLITVADNGRGIEPRDHERIFDLFRRSGTQDQPGEGIGLAHVRALAYRLGGTITVASELGRGATFTINLPAHFAGEQDPAT